MKDALKKSDAWGEMNHALNGLKSVLEVRPAIQPFDLPPFGGKLANRVLVFQFRSTGVEAH